MPYQVAFERDLFQRAASYAQALAANRATSGSSLAARLAQRARPHSGSELLEALLQTKRPQIFAESEVAGDGVKAAATSSMLAMTEIAGSYDAVRNMYLPPKGYKNWEQYVSRNDLTLRLGEPFICD